MLDDGDLEAPYPAVWLGGGAASQILTLVNEARGTQFQRPWLFESKLTNYDQIQLFYFRRIDQQTFQI